MSQAIAEARKLMATELQNDESFRQTYRANIVCLLMDEMKLSHVIQNDIADKLIDLIFGKPEKSRYWMCIVGPTDQNALPDACDLHMRRAVQDAFQKIVGDYPEILSSGWGVTEECRKRLLEAWRTE